MAIKFVTDSMTDAGQNLRSEYDYDVIPIPIAVGNKTYMDGIDITPEMVMEFGQSGENFPKTSQISSVAYQNAFEKHLEKGDDVVYVGLSSGLSGTFQAANIAAQELREKYPDRKIILIDSKTASIAQAMLLQQGLKLAKLDKPIEEIEETLNFLRDHLNIYFVVGDLKWMGKGGRISKGAATLGNLLNIVPILYFNDGKIEVFDKVRGKRKATKKLEGILKNALAENENQTIAMLNSNNDDSLEKLLKVTTKFPHTHVMVPEKGAGSALTVHTGDDVYGIAFFDELPENYINVNP